MWNWLKGIFKKKRKQETDNRHICEKCVWWAAEESNNAPTAEEFSKLFAKYPGQYKMCDIHKEYTHAIHRCNNFIEEKFEATENSIQTEELEINHELSVERVDNK